MKYETKDNLNLIEYLQQLDLKLSQIEVKGDSVISLFFSRGLIETMFKSLVEIKEEEKEIKKESKG